MQAKEGQAQNVIVGAAIFAAIILYRGRDDRSHKNIMAS